jgi:phosphoglycolate phosphatase
VTSDHADASKPDPDLVEVALERAGSRNAVMVGDSVWDVQAAGRARIPALGLRCGGFADSELSGAGAAAVFDNPQDLVDRFEESGLPAQVG